MASSSPINIHISDCIMLFARTAARGAIGLRAFSTARVCREELSYQVYGPETDQVVRDPILFLHGLFGSKQNNRSISKYVLSALI
jgi:pimeloyl-ACP methyl ester carboxylesterase